MNFFGLIFEVLFYQPIYNLLMFLYSLTGNNLGIAIIIVALIVKLITIPLTKKQLESGKKMKTFQEKSKHVKEKFKKNKEKMNEELMKLTSEYMPAQLSGCLPLIISIIFLIQVRTVVVNLVNQGYESFNKVAYVQSLKFDVDSATFQPKEDLNDGENTLSFVIKASNGNEYNESVKFVKESDEKTASNKAKEIEKTLTKEQKEEIEKQYEKNRESNISIHIENFDKGKFVTEAKPTFKTFLRPPSNETISEVSIELNGTDITKDAEITKGEKLNLNFLGMDLSKVGTDYIGDWLAFAPYLVLSLLIGASQFATTKLQMGLNPDFNNKKAEKKKDSKKDDKEPDFSEIMQQSSQQMIYMMPLMTAGISLGFLGGARFFPTAVSLFWTANNLFVIIQQLYNSKAEVLKLLKSKSANKLNTEIEAK